MFEIHLFVNNLRWIIDNTDEEELEETILETEADKRNIS